MQGPAVMAAVAVGSVIDFAAVLIDGGFPPAVRARLVAEVDRRLDAIDSQGVARPRIMAAALVPMPAKSAPRRCRSRRSSR